MLFKRMVAGLNALYPHVLLRMLLCFFCFFSVHSFSAGVSETSASKGSVIKVVTTFSVLADMVEQIGGEYVKVHTLVDWDEDAHVFQPSPDDVQQIAQADLLVLNGLGFEGWLARLLRAADYKGASVEASKGIDYLTVGFENGFNSHSDHDHYGHNEHKKLIYDPHAWHSLSAAKIYVTNIAQVLIKIDSAHSTYYEENLTQYVSQLGKVDLEIRARLSDVPLEKRRIVVPHNAFAYFARDYQVQIHGLQGVSTDSEASAADITKIIRLIRSLNIQAIFTENISDKRLIRVVESETKAKIKGALVSGALSKKLAPSYLDMMQYNSDLIIEALTQH